jgi:hypothetical protein
MLFHVSIEADRPRHVAEVIAELWQGRALPFPPVGVGSWVAFAGDDRGTIVEVYQRGTELRENHGDADAVGVQGAPRRHNATHIAIATSLDAEAVFAIAEREGWPAKACNRGGKFHLIELWVEGCQMVEVLTGEMQREYLDCVTIENWERMLQEYMPIAA